MQRIQLFLPSDSRSAKLCIAIISRPPVCLSVRLSVMLMYRVFAPRSRNVRWQSSPRRTPQNSGGIGVRRSSQQKTCNISETGENRTKVTIDDLAYVLLIGAKINDLGWPWRAITYSVSKHVHLSEPTTKIWMKIYPTISDDDVAQWL